MKRKTICFVILGAGFLGSCAATYGGIESPVRPVWIKGASEQVTHVYWTYMSSLGGADKAARNQHLKQYEPRLSVPLFINAVPGEFLWIAPVCGGSAKWDKADLRQVPGDGTPIEVSC